jgi:hypothetical protein
MKCTNCGAELALEERFCKGCGAPRPELPSRFAEAERRFATLRARYQAGVLDDAAYDAELRKLVIEDGTGYWMLGADSGEWYWYDPQGQKWVRRDPLLAAAADRAQITSGWQLIIANGPSAGQSFPLGNLVHLGREAGSEICLADRLVSRRHAVLEQVAFGYIITDQGSSNGTYVNGVRISRPTTLQSGDKITIGNMQFTILDVTKSPSAGPEETIVCPACGARMKPGRRFCTQCGALLPAAKSAMALNGRAVICPSCRSSNPPENRFCTWCGAPL